MWPESSGNESALDRMAENALLKLVSRWAMVLAAAALPMFGYFGSRVVNEVDEAVKRINETATRVEVIQQRIEDARSVRDAQFLSFKGMLDDHEARLRALEKRH